jgi:DNA-directed RNA polymerase subunit M/transcription elongation factor TFIIS
MKTLEHVLVPQHSVTPEEIMAHIEAYTKGEVALKWPSRLFRLDDDTLLVAVDKTCSAEKNRECAEALSKAVHADEPVSTFTTWDTTQIMRI